MTCLPDAEPVDAAVAEALASQSEVDLGWLREDAEDDWALTGEALRFVVRLVQLVAPAHVVELGSGRSTRALARAAQTMSPAPRITSLENDPAAAARTTAALEVDGTRDLVELRFAPVVVRRCQGRQVPVYHLGDGALRGCAEVILVDGPPLPMGGREGALYQAVDLATKDALIVLDDAHRESEVSALEHLAEGLGDRIRVELLDGFDKGLAVVRVLEATALSMEIDQGATGRGR